MSLFYMPESSRAALKNFRKAKLDYLDYQTSQKKKMKDKYDIFNAQANDMNLNAPKVPEKSVSLFFSQG